MNRKKIQIFFSFFFFNFSLSLFPSPLSYFPSSWKKFKNPQTNPSNNFNTLNGSQAGDVQIKYSDASLKVQVKPFRLPFHNLFFNVLWLPVAWYNRINTSPLFINLKLTPKAWLKALVSRQPGWEIPIKLTRH